MKHLIQRHLAWHAKRVLNRYRPTIVAVTGSVGKTSARNAIAAVLDAKFRVRSPEENYNNEFGVPLTIIGAKTPGKSVIGWLRVFAKAFSLSAFAPSPLRPYPNMLVLEYGLDRPGDIKNLCKIAPPDVGVFTAVSPVHAEYFDSLEELAREKGEIVRSVREGGAAVMNGDDTLVMSQSSLPLDKGEVGGGSRVTYGFSDGLDVRAEGYRVETREDFSFDPGEEFCAIHFDLVIGDERAPVMLSNLLGRGQVYAALAAASVGKHFGLSIDEIVEGFKNFKPQAGRMRPLPGIKGTLVLDDSYNAAPASMAAALEVLRYFTPVESARRVAVLGKMAELGRYSENEHRLLGMRAAEVADLLVCVGEEARDIRRGAVEAGMDETSIQAFADSVEAGRWLDFNVKQGDVILVKGSQSSRMERTVKDLIAEPARAAKLLVRQYGSWLEE